MNGYGSTLELARWCESNGVPALAVADHYLSGPNLDSPAYEQFVVLGGIVRETTTLELSTLVSPITFRHPAVLLKAAVTLDEMSGGRFTLGVGTGWMQSEHDAFGLELFEMGERFDRLEEALAYLTAAVDGGGEGFEGRYYTLQPFVPHPIPARLRLVVGGTGRRRTPALAGRFADEFNVFPDESGWVGRIGTARQAAADTGRDPATLLISAAFPAVAGEDEREYEDTLARVAESRGREVDELRQSLDRLHIPSGTPEQMASRLTAMADAGIQRVYLQLGGSAVDEFARAVRLVRHALG
jgi:alkanesulfonate monooxygenase SsuD/methylene tetrahydromethanopterin reductase-like flavin-dependent oxidoreductase (luciferase family)